jgi:serine/threonine-protein kinase
LLTLVVGLAVTLIAVSESRGHSLAVQLAAGGCLAIGSVLVPLVAGLSAIALSVRAFRNAAGLESLVSVVLRDGGIDRALLEAKLGAERADRTIVFARERGGVSAAEAIEAAPTTPSTPRIVIPESAYTPRLAEITLGHAATSLATPSVRPPAMPETSTPAPEPVVELAPLDLVGRTLKGTWDVERRLASGGMGTVYVARHVRTGRRYALKTVLPSAQLSPDAIARFEREARAATAIGHAGIAAVHDFDRTSEGVHYLVMDLLVGESLESRLARVGRLSWPEARRVSLEVGDALAAAHRASVLHRDVKPSNVFMATRDGAPERAMLVDFGLAKPITPGRGDAVTRTGAIVGTAHYMAPEQARGEPLDERTDVYGLGATMYEMVAGVPPFLGASPIAVMAMLLNETAVAPSVLGSNIPPAVDTIILRALAKAPTDRYADLPSMMRAIEAADGV